MNLSTSELSPMSKVDDFDSPTTAAWFETETFRARLILSSEL